jgi:hypothetical protein
MSDRPRHTVVRPVCPGLRILNPECGTPGTIGLFGRDEHDRTWIVSCRHVLLRPAEVPDDQLAGPEEIHQPGPGLAYSVIADSDVTRQNLALDCAAAVLRPALALDPGVFGLGSVLGRPAQPRLRMRVIKSGAQTGVTRGVVTLVGGSRIRISLPDDAAEDTILSMGGDSGAVWFEEDTLAPIGLHRRGNVAGVEFALASPMDAVMATLQLQVVTS